MTNLIIEEILEEELVKNCKCYDPICISPTCNCWWRHDYFRVTALFSLAQCKTHIDVMIFSEVENRTTYH